MLVAGRMPTATATPTADGENEIEAHRRFRWCATRAGQLDQSVGVRGFTSHIVYSSRLPQSHCHYSSLLPSLLACPQASQSTHVSSFHHPSYTSARCLDPRMLQTPLRHSPEPLSIVGEDWVICSLASSSTSAACLLPASFLPPSTSRTHSEHKSTAHDVPSPLTGLHLLPLTQSCIFPSISASEAVSSPILDFFLMHIVIVIVVTQHLPRRLSRPSTSNVPSMQSLSSPSLSPFNPDSPPTSPPPDQPYNPQRSPSPPPSRPPAPFPAAEN